MRRPTFWKLSGPFCPGVLHPHVELEPLFSEHNGWPYTMSALDLAGAVDLTRKIVVRDKSGKLLTS